MGKELLKFDDLEIEKQKFHACKSDVGNVGNIGNELLVQKKFTRSKIFKNDHKFFIHYKNNERV